MLNCSVGKSGDERWSRKLPMDTLRKGDGLVWEWRWRQPCKLDLFLGDIIEYWKISMPSENPWISTNRRRRIVSHREELIIRFKPGISRRWLMLTKMQSQRESYCRKTSYKVHSPMLIMSIAGNECISDFSEAYRNQMQNKDILYSS